MREDSIFLRPSWKLDLLFQTPGAKDRPSSLAFPIIKIRVFHLLNHLQSRHGHSKLAARAKWRQIYTVTRKSSRLRGGDGKEY